MPHVSQQKGHRSNPKSDSAEQYFKRTIVILFVDHLINDLFPRFDVHTKQVAPLQRLLTVNITPASSMKDIEEAIAFYNRDLSSNSMVDEEFHVWKTKWLEVLSKDRPQTLSAYMKNCCQQTLPNKFTSSLHVPAIRDPT